MKYLGTKVRTKVINKASIYLIRMSLNEENIVVPVKHQNV